MGSSRAISSNDSLKRDNCCTGRYEECRVEWVTNVDDSANGDKADCGEMYRVVEKSQLLFVDMLALINNGRQSVEKGDKGVRGEVQCKQEV